MTLFIVNTPWLASFSLIVYCAWRGGAIWAHACVCLWSCSKNKQRSNYRLGLRWIKGGLYKFPSFEELLKAPSKKDASYFKFLTKYGEILEKFTGFILRLTDLPWPTINTDSMANKNQAKAGIPFWLVDLMMISTGNFI